MNHRLAAIQAADVAGCSRLMSMDDKATVTALDAAPAVFRMQVDAHQGRFIDMAGDSVLAVVGSAVAGTRDAAQSRGCYSATRGHGIPSLAILV